MAGRVETAMDLGIDAAQTERVLSQLARLRHRGNREEMDVLDSLKPSWLGADAWDIILEDLDAQHYRERDRERVRVPRLRLVVG
jgi:hypothetical protein